MARFDGIRNGAAVFGWTVLIAVLVAILGAVAGAKYDVLDNLNSFPRIPPTSPTSPPRASSSSSASSPPPSSAR